MIRSAAALLAMSVALAGCGGSGTGESKAQDGPEGCVTDYAEDQDYFPDKSTVEESELWDISYHDSYKTITLADTEKADGDPLRYVLYQCGTPKPKATGDLSDALFVQVPVTKVSVTSFNALAMVDRLGKNDTITGLSGQLLGSAKTDAWYAGVVKDAGNPMSIGEYTDLDREAVLGLQTQAILMSGFGEGFDDVSNARSAGLPGVSVSNRMEEHALASAEWIKMIAAFYNAEGAANAEFKTIKSKFDKVVSTVSGKVDDRDAGYLCVSAERGCEFIYGHGKDTLVGRLLTELGTGNVFTRDNDGPNGKPYDYEAAIGTGADADFFVVYDPMKMTLETLNSDPRMKRFQPFKKGAFIAGVDKNFEECRAKTYLDVDVLIRDLAIGLAPDLFPGEKGTCFTRSS
ncbi:ABC transporter substrate-binding protein [Streptomyces scopuliridis]|uniref:ABC transporter substrate-binding protein n=1 Tax=Streptomyces scopuliridis TaxID=452529 RepID=A0ACD4ZZ00_9ACTN|nr:ABC transporter substrate-binding protein [Streptomyces scopuliridis]WSB38652.1 ABC transporter substrate-binding protein [Streptomyces scopuliridis]WSC03102.1 ABC transporter substrate-binding protein [Streptomyces scopuliridis]WSC11022.1 ABC transporter substrate-binding protein [Streptomyces scopuliridis]